MHDMMNVWNALRPIEEHRMPQGMPMAIYPSTMGSAALNAREENGRFILEMSNPADLPDGEYDQVFDRNIRLANAAGQPGTGLGLNRVRDEVRAMNGRLSARVKDGVFTVRISL